MTKLHKWQELQQKIEQQISPQIHQIEDREQRLQAKVLQAFRRHRVSESELHDSTGYGYDDRGREVLEKLYAEVFGTEMALVRPHLISGTHAITACLFGVLRPGDEMIYLTGQPYDTLLKVIGNGKDGSGSLTDYGTHYREVDLKPDGQIDWLALQQIISEKTRLICIQRSRGYSHRPSFSIIQIAEMVNQIRRLLPEVVIFVDNCYGEWVELQEPTHVGADLIAGSLIKNPGAGLAKSGGYIAGKRKWVEKAASRLVAPGIGIEGGATYGYLRDFYQGLFLAPHVVAEALKGAVFTAAILEELGYETSPVWNEQRADIVQQIHLGSADRLLAFCRGIQAQSPIGAHILPEPAPMPGYCDDVIMAAGTFVQGASIELSADGPLRPPYTAYIQGGLTFTHVKIAILEALQRMID